MLKNEALELANILYLEDNIRLTEDESIELSGLFKDGPDIEGDLEHYFGVLDSEINADQRRFIDSHDFLFEFYVLADNVYLVLDNRLDVSLESRSKEFKDRFCDILRKRIKEKGS